MKKLRLFDSLKFVRFVVAVVAATFILSAAHADTSINSVIAYGKTEQSGTPTPTNPVPIMTNNGVLKVNSQGQIYTDGLTETIRDSAGHTATAQMLLGINDTYRDEQNINTGAITRKVGVKVLDGTENWVVAQGTDNAYLQASELPGVKTNSPVLCSHLINSSTGTSRIQLTGVLRVYGIGTEWADKANFQSWLADQYAAGTPVIVVYPLATETTESVATQQMTTAPVRQTAGSILGMPIEVVLGDGTREWVRDMITIATTKYNEESFAPVKTDLSAAVNAVEYVVSNTMSQAQAIDQIANEKQTRPDEGCMAKYCLLVEDEDGTPHWYPIAGANGVEYNLPSGYTQLEYIGASSGQFINTGINPTDQMIIKTDILFVSDDISVFGGSQNNTNKMQVYKYLNKIFVRFHNQTSSTLQPVISNNNWYSLKIDYSNSYGTINDTTTSIIKTDAEQITYPIYIWANNIAGTISGGTGGSYIKFFEIRNSDGTNLFYGVPARRNSDNVVGMYDMVSGQFFTNAGTGTFVASPDM